MTDPPLKWCTSRDSIKIFPSKYSFQMLYVPQAHNNFHNNFEKRNQFCIDYEIKKYWENVKEKLSFRVKKSQIFFVWKYFLFYFFLPSFLFLESALAWRKYQAYENNLIYCEEFVHEIGKKPLMNQFNRFRYPIPTSRMKHSSVQV